jgi:hypothetical protein
MELKKLTTRFQTIHSEKIAEKMVLRSEKIFLKFVVFCFVFFKHFFQLFSEWLLPVSNRKVSSSSTPPKLERKGAEVLNVALYCKKRACIYGEALTDTEEEDFRGRRFGIESNLITS